MSMFLGKGAPTGPRKHMHRLLQQRTEPSPAALSSPSVQPSGTVSSSSSTPATTPLVTPSTPVSTLTSSTPSLFGTTSAPLFTTSSTPTSSTSPIVGTTPSTTTTPSPAPSSTTTPTAPIVNEQQDTHRDGRLHIQVDGKQLDPSGKCAYIMRKSFVDRVDRNGYKWVTISAETKQFYWEEFQKKCYWDVEDGAAVEIAWNCMAKEKYRQYIYNMSSRTRNPALQKPSHIEEHVWVAWNAVWNSEEFKMKSEQNKKNRRKGVEGGIAPPTHNGGSASHKQIALDMEKCMGRPPSCFDLFMFTHTKNHDGKTLDNEKSKKVHDYYESQRAASDALGEDAYDSEVFYKAVGGHDSKKRVYGLGSYGSSIFLEKSFNGKCTSPDTNPQHNLKSKIQKLEATVEQQQVELEGMKNTVNDLRSMMEK